MLVDYLHCVLFAHVLWSSPKDYGVFQFERLNGLNLKKAVPFIEVTHHFTQIRCRVDIEPHPGREYYLLAPLVLDRVEAVRIWEGKVVEPHITLDVRKVRHCQKGSLVFSTLALLFGQECNGRVLTVLL